MTPSELQQIERLGAYYFAFTHPFRIALLMGYSAQVESPKTMAKKLNKPLSNTNYHTKVLHNTCGLLVLEKTRQRGSTVQHFYRAKTRQELDLHDLSFLPPEVRDIAQGTLLARFAEGAAQALQSEGLDSDGSTFEGGLAKFDAEGWREASQLLDVTTKRIAEIEVESSRRLGRAAPGTAIQALFGSALLRTTVATRSGA